jgi:hypothetical protein
MKSFVGNFDMTSKRVFLINISNISLQKQVILRTILVSNQINSFLQFIEQEITQKYFDTFDMDVRNVGIVLFLDRL